MEEVLISESGEVDRLTIELREAILRSEEYLRYEEAYTIIKKDPDLYASVNELRRNNYMLQNRQTGTMSYEEYLNISNHSKAVRENPVINRFLNAEVDLGRLIQKVTQEIVQGIDFDVDFL